MATVIEVDRSGVWEAIDYQDFAIEVVTSAIAPTPSATVVTQAREDLTANQDLRITIDGTVAFEGVTNSPGKVRRTGAVELSVDHPAAALFSEQVDLSFDGPNTAQGILGVALDAAERGGDFTIDYAGTTESLNGDYEVTERPITQVFRDMMDRTSRVWWVDPAGTTIHVEPVGGRGTWQSLDATADGVQVQSFNSGSVSTVRNDVTVTATGGEAVSATATDSTSITEYGRRSESINIGYTASQSEAQAYADELLIPDPLAQAELAVPSSVGDIVQPLANFTLDLTDDPKQIDATGLTIEKQTIEQGRATLKVGEGSGVSLENVNRNSKSSDDETAPGTVYGNDRLGTDSVDSEQLVDASVIEAKLDELAVTTQKLRDNAVINGKLADLSVSETKIQDDSISTPKLVAEAVTAAKIEADTITAAEIAAGTITALEIASDTITAGEIAAGTITALEIAADTLTANEIDTLDLDTSQLFIGADTTTGYEFQVDGTNDWVEMLPSSAGAFCVIGSSDRQISSIWSEAVRGTNVVLGGKGTVSESSSAAEFRPDGTTSDILIREDGGEAMIAPDSDNTSFVGDPFVAFAEMNAHNFVTQTPDPLDTVDLEKLTGYSWRSPPEYATRRKATASDDRDYYRANPSQKGLSLDHMTNYLLETCKAQQRTIEDLTDRLSELEARLDALEDPNA